MLSEPITVTVDAVAKSLPRVNQDNNGSTYYLDDGQQKYTLSVKHTIPPRGESGESHLVRLDVEQYDTDGMYLRTQSAWMVLKTWDQGQDSAELDIAGQGLVDLMTDTFLDSIIQRES
uniref:Uncharacterized protein n=1 Tax=Wenling levi-like virus 1 TaxID=1923497 RepID=A0A1L3KIW5_9VIRU|nr:hypothetical protein [Wenling levi-like virus 1]